MPKKQHRIILTGGPGSGKSTLINTLKDNGYACSQEAGRAIIQDQVRIGGHALPWIDPNSFAQLMLNWELRSWHDAELNEAPYFYDRGIPDVAGYLKLCYLPIPNYLDNAIKTFRYSNVVFIAPPWKEIYTCDTERKQSFEEAKKTYFSMKEIYKEYGYNLIELPKSNIDNRINFILDNIDKVY